jgi:aspartate 1-decarboxylase
MNTLELSHLINGKYVHIIQITDGARRTYYTDGKREGVVDITGPSYAERKYELETYTLKTYDGEYERKRAKH